jgi:hypothetical protein
VLDDEDDADTFTVGGDGTVEIKVPSRGQKVLVAEEDRTGIP